MPTKRKTRKKPVTPPSRIRSVLRRDIFNKKLDSQTYLRYAFVKTKESQMENLIGKKYGRLTVLDLIEYSKTGHTGVWNCECECGNIVKARGNNIKNGHTRSCGCYQEETRGKHSYKHGHSANRSPSKTYTVWQGIKLRCLNPRHEHYKYYGARGITVCPEWLDFQNFLKDMGEVEEGLELDRINNDLGYFKENCRWTTRKENVRNRRYRNIEYMGNKYGMTELAEMLEIPEHALRRRIKYWGMSVDEAIVSYKTRHKCRKNSNTLLQAE